MAEKVRSAAVKIFMIGVSYLRIVGLADVILMIRLSAFVTQSMA